jgi:hypothetical protein
MHYCLVVDVLPDVSLNVSPPTNDPTQLYIDAMTVIQSTPVATVLKAVKSKISGIRKEIHKEIGN